MTLVIHCECGATPTGETEDEVVAAAEAHIQEAHPEMAGQVSREQLLALVHEH